MYVWRSLKYLLIGTPKRLKLGLFLPSREYAHRKPALAFFCGPRYIPEDAQVPRHTPHHNRDAHSDYRDALADGPAVPGAGGERQARASRRLRCAGLSAGAHGPLRALTSLHRRERIRRCH